MKCRDCKWWAGDRKGEAVLSYGDCRVNPPRVVQMGDMNSGFEHDTVWPRTDAPDWCAKWEAYEGGPAHISEAVERVIDDMVDAQNKTLSGGSEATE